MESVRDDMRSSENVVFTCCCAFGSEHGRFYCYVTPRPGRGSKGVIPTSRHDDLDGFLESHADDSDIPRAGRSLPAA